MPATDWKAEAAGDGKKLRHSPRERLLHRLAIAAGRLDVEELSEELGPEVIDRWLAWEEVDGRDFGQLLEVLCKGFAFVCLANGMKVEPQEFLPVDLRQECLPPVQSSAEQIAIIRSIVSRSGGAA